MVYALAGSSHERETSLSLSLFFSRHVAFYHASYRYYYRAPGSSARRFQTHYTIFNTLRAAVLSGASVLWPRVCSNCPLGFVRRLSRNQNCRPLFERGERVASSGARGRGTNLEIKGASVCFTTWGARARRGGREKRTTTTARPAIFKGTQVRQTAGEPMDNESLEEKIATSDYRKALLSRRSRAHFAKLLFRSISRRSCRTIARNKRSQVRSESCIHKDIHRPITAVQATTARYTVTAGDTIRRRAVEKTWKIRRTSLGRYFASRCVTSSTMINRRSRRERKIAAGFIMHYSLNNDERQ